MRMIFVEEKLNTLWAYVTTIIITYDHHLNSFLQETAESAKLSVRQNSPAAWLIGKV